LSGLSSEQLAVPGSGGPVLPAAEVCVDSAMVCVFVHIMESELSSLQLA